MDRKQQLLIRNIVGGIVFLILFILALVYFGVFDSEESDEAQIRALIDRSKQETNDHDWDDLFQLGDMDAQQREAWINNVPRGANLVVVDDIRPKEIISIAPSETKYILNVTVVAHMKNPINGTNIRGDVVNGELFFVKKDGRWFIDFDRSADTFPYISRP